MQRTSVYAKSLSSSFYDKSCDLLTFGAQCVCYIDHSEISDEPELDVGQIYMTRPNLTHIL